MNILITGIAGQIGSRLSEILQQKSISHRGIDFAPCKTPGPFMQADLTKGDNGEDLRNFLAPVTHVIHLAGKISETTNFRTGLTEQFNVSVLSTLNLLEALPRTIQHISFSSSMVVYGCPEKNPVEETAALKPRNLYAWGKIAAEKYLSFYAKEIKIPIAMLRYSSVYGPGRITSRAIPNMIENSLNKEAPVINGTGKTTRDYVYIDDVSHATILATMSAASGNYNIGSGTGTSIKDLAEYIVNLTDLSSRPSYNKNLTDGYSLYYDINKAAGQLKYNPKVDLVTGLKKTIDWHILQRQKDENFNK